MLTTPMPARSQISRPLCSICRLLVWLCAGLLLFGWSSRLSAKVVINEFMAAASDRRLTWTPAGAPRLGSGVAWHEPEFSAVNWTNLTLPAGYSYSGLSTSLQNSMRDKAYSIYLRKEFNVTEAQIQGGQPLVLSAQCNDGFVAYLNGREVARWNCGPTNHFVFASQPAYNPNTLSTGQEFVLGSASSLKPGINVLAIQAHNADKPSTPSSPQQISSHVPSTEFRIDAGLRLAADPAAQLPEIILVALGPGGGSWKHIIGRAEPSGGLVDLGLATRPFAMPPGEEDDFEQLTEFSDWVELHNSGSTPVNISGWSLSDDENVPGKWRFPLPTVIPAGGYLLVLCDNRDEANAPGGPATYLHSNFKLADDGESLALYDKNGVYVDGPVAGYPSQVFHCSYGRDPSNPSQYVYLQRATPGQANAGETYPARAAAPRFLAPNGSELPGGLYAVASLDLHLSTATPGASIYYSRSGAEPTEQKGIRYSIPLALRQTSDRTGIVVRARGTVPGWLPSETVTHTYVLRQPPGLTNSPALFLTGEAGRTFYAPEGVLAIVGGSFADSIWYASGPKSYNNVIGNGAAYEREAELEFFFPKGYYPGGQAPARTGIGLRVSASPWQRPRMRLAQAATASPWPTGDTTEKPSFNVFFRSDYGESSLRYPLFTNYLVREFQHLRLRAGKNDNRNPFITDELTRRLFHDMGHSSARGLFSSLYVNGVYKGVYNVTERIREAFFQAHYGGQFGWDVSYVNSWVNGDNAAYLQLLAALDRNLTNAANWKAVTDLIDIENAADYFLLNIYCATWDWPNNNYVIARERTTGPAGRFRFAVWDAEGACNATGYGKAVSYNTLTSDLLVPSGHSWYNLPLPRIFRRLVSSPEFRLYFADRVSRHLFGGGVLDDRDPDGAGPRTSFFRARLDNLVREANDLVRYNTGQNIALNAFNTWNAPTTGRRTYLLGTTPGRRMLRDAGLWPATEPPSFSQHGGVIIPGQTVLITTGLAGTGQTSTVWFTIDGSDPRLPGGQRAPGAMRYAQPLPLTGGVTIQARALNDVTGEWSSLAEAKFILAPQPANATNLVVAEVMYHPPGLIPAEVAADIGDPDDCEFVRLLNISLAPVHLGGVRFTQGVTFDFDTAPSPWLHAGQSMLVVKDHAAFRKRYGTAYDSRIAGEFNGNFSNGGETVLLMGTNGAPLRQFTYEDRSPWPVSPDGGGPSLLLRNPFGNPDPRGGANWMASALPGGLPGGVSPELSYEAWRGWFWDGALADTNSAAAADSDGDGISNFLEYVSAQNPREPSAWPRMTAQLVAHDNAWHLLAETRLAPGATDAIPQWEFLGNDGRWQATSEMQTLEILPQTDGAAVFRFLNATAASHERCKLLRLQFRQK